MLIAALAFAALTARLGVWQLDRAAQKLALRDADERQGRLPALPGSELAADPAAAELQHYRRVRLEGRWLAEHTVFLENRQMDARPGFFVLTPLLLSDGSAVVVQRGWQPRDQADRARVVMPDTPPDRLIGVEGVIAPPPSRLYDFAGAASGALRQNIDLISFSLEIGRRLRPLSILQEDSPATSGDGLARHWLRPADDVYKHYGYAFQWFALCALTIGLHVWFQIIGPRRGQRT